MIYRNATSSDPEGLRVALLDMIRLGLGWDKFYNSEIANHAGGNIVVARNFEDDTGRPRSTGESGQVARTSQPCRPAYQPGRQARGAYRIRSSLVRFEGDRICDHEGT